MRCLSRLATWRTVSARRATNLSRVPFCVCVFASLHLCISMYVPMMPSTQMFNLRTGIRSRHLDDLGVTPLGRRATVYFWAPCSGPGAPVGGSIPGCSLAPVGTADIRSHGVGGFAMWNSFTVRLGNEQPLRFSCVPWSTCLLVKVLVLHRFSGTLPLPRPPRVLDGGLLGDRYTQKAV